jgi:hypothetical protein
MNQRDEPFVPSDPALYGPDPATERCRARPLRDVLGLSARQFGAVVGISLFVFAFVAGPFWSAARATFPLRLFASYLIIPVLVVPLLRWSHTLSWQTFFAASLAAAGVKFLATVIIDVVQGLVRNWPP